jgi:hypothetical protein
MEIRNVCPKLENNVSSTPNDSTRGWVRKKRRYIKPLRPSAAESIEIGLSDAHMVLRGDAGLDRHLPLLTGQMFDVDHILFLVSHVSPWSSIPLQLNSIWIVSPGAISMPTISSR